MTATQSNLSDSVFSPIQSLDQLGPVSRIDMQSMVTFYDDYSGHRDPFSRSIRVDSWFAARGESIEMLMD